MPASVSASDTGTLTSLSDAAQPKKQPVEYVKMKARNHKAKASHTYADGNLLQGFGQPQKT